MSKAAANAAVAVAPDPSTKVRLTLSIPEPIFSTYQAAAAARHVTIERELADRLSRCRSHADSGIWFTSDERADLERLTGGHVSSTPAQLLERIRTTCQLRIGEVVLTLDERIMARLRTRVMRGETLEDVIAREALKGLKEFTGAY